MKLDKRELLINAISGAGFPSMDFAIQEERCGLAHFTGNQMNPKWEWNRETLRGLKIESLETIYDTITADDLDPIRCDNLHPFTAHKIRKAEEFLRDILGEGEYGHSR